MKNRYCVGACLPEGLMLRSSLRTILSKPYCVIVIASDSEAIAKTLLMTKDL